MKFHEISCSNGPFSGRTQVTPIAKEVSTGLCGSGDCCEEPQRLFFFFCWRNRKKWNWWKQTSGCFLIHVFCWHHFFFLEEIFRPLGLDAFLFWQVCLLERLLQRRVFLECLGLPKAPKDSTRWKLLLMGGFVPWKLVVRKYQSFRKFESFSQIISLYRGLPKPWNSG